MMEAVQEKVTQNFGTLTLEQTAEHFQVYIVLEKGADIPTHLARIIKKITQKATPELSEVERSAIKKTFHQDISALEGWQQTEVKKAIISGNVGIRLLSREQITFRNLHNLPPEFRQFTG